MTTYRYKKVQQATKREKRFVNDTNCKSIFILFEGKTLHEMNAFAAEIRESLAPKKIIFCGYVRKLKKNEAGKIVHFDKLITKKSLTLFGNPHEADISWARAVECDLLVNLEATENNALDIITAASTAPMKCGRNIITKKPHLFDFMLDVPAETSPKELLVEILNYVNSIQRKK